MLDAVARISEEFRIPWVRRPFDFPLQPGGIGWKKRAVNRSLSGARPRRTRLARPRLPFHRSFRGIPDHREIMTRPRWFRLIRALPEGSTEFMCHPGRCGEELRAARTRLKESREQELRALTVARGSRGIGGNERASGGVRSVVAIPSIAAQRQERHELRQVETGMQNGGRRGGAGPVSHESECRPGDPTSVICCHAH